jgi:VWFA-related protein
MHPLTARPRWCVILAICTWELALAWTAVFPVSRLSAQTRFRGGVDLVEADALVLDAKGHPVPGLTAADFTLTVDGQPRAIESVDYVAAGRPGASRDTDAASLPGAAPPRSALRHVVFVVDEGNISAGGGKAAMAAAGRLLDRLGPADRIALLPIPSGPAVDFTVEHAPIRAALDRRIGRAARPTGADDFSMSLQEVYAFDIGATVDERSTQQTVINRLCPQTMQQRELCEDSVRADAQARLESYRERSRAAVAGLDTLFRALAKMPGPKVVVLVSEGLLMRPDQRDGSVVSQLAALAVAARITLCSVLLEGPLVDAGEAGHAHSSTMAQDRAIEEDGLKTLTSQSGGLLLRAPAAPDGAFERLGDALSAYYLVAFRVAPTDGDGPHKIRLQTTRPALTVHARAQFVMTPVLRRASSGEPGDIPRSPGQPRRSDAPSSFAIDKVALQLATRTIADANGTVRILFSLDVRDPAAHVTSALALGYKLKAGDRIVADSGRVVPVTRGPDGTAQPISYIAFQGLAPGTYELQLSASDGSKHSAYMTHPVSARLHPVGAFGLSDLLLAGSAANAEGPFPVPASLVVSEQLVAGIEVTAADRAALANVTVRFEVVSAQAREIAASQDAPLSPSGSLSQFVRATLNLSGISPGRYLTRASIVVDGAPIGLIDAPFQLAR